LFLYLGKPITITPWLNHEHYMTKNVGTSWGIGVGGFLHLTPPKGEGSFYILAIHWNLVKKSDEFLEIFRFICEILELKEQKRTLISCQLEQKEWPLSKNLPIFVK
jgi:hypothetical protein